MGSDTVVVVAAKRTPVGAFQGVLSGATATQLGSAAIEAAVAQSGVSAEEIEDLLARGVVH